MTSSARAVAGTARTANPISATSAASRPAGNARACYRSPPRMPRSTPRSLLRERDLRHLARLLVGLEERALDEAEAAGHQVARKRLDHHVEVARGAVVVAARHLDLVLDRAELFLQVQEVLVRLQVG